MVVFLYPAHIALIIFAGSLPRHLCGVALLYGSRQINIYKLSFINTYTGLYTFFIHLTKLHF